MPAKQRLPRHQKQHGDITESNSLDHFIHVYQFDVGLVAIIFTLVLVVVLPREVVLVWPLR